MIQLELATVAKTIVGYICNLQVPSFEDGPGSPHIYREGIFRSGKER